MKLRGDKPHIYSSILQTIGQSIKEGECRCASEAVCKGTVVGLGGGTNKLRLDAELRMCMCTEDGLRADTGQSSKPELLLWI